MTTQVSAISNSCASIIGGISLYYASELDSEQLKLAATTAIPACTLFIAYIFKLCGSYGALNLLKFLFKRTAEKRLRSLQKAMDNEYISEEKREKYQKDYEETNDIIMGIENDDMKELKTMTDGARSKLKKDISSGYQNNKELTESLNPPDGNSPSKP